MTTPKEHPILFSGEMVEAILKGRKTQTRRVIKPQPSGGVRLTPFFPSHLEDGHGRAIKVRFDVGDMLWVRETWAALHPNTDVALESVNPRPGICTLAFKATETRGIVGKWRSPIFMPRWASRITLEIVGVMVQRLNRISDDDAIEEGVDRTNTSIPTYAIQRYRTLWDSINAKRGYSWESNPWVWAITFRRVLPAEPDESPF